MSDHKESEILSNLNNQQKEAVLDIDNNSRIIAGPGTGKTTTIIAKILYLIFVKGVEPWKILAITFTNKAKDEIIERILKFDSNESNIPKIYTYHSFATYLLRLEKKSQPNEKDFIIIDRTDQKRIVKNLLKSNEQIKGIDDKTFLAELSNIRNLIAESIRTPKIKNMYALFELYELHKKNNNLLDFDDLIPRANDILENNSEIKEIWSKKYDYIFVDEFQDTNREQFELIRNISNENTRITVVGDPDQNLYTWRGANIDLILNFDKYFNNTKTYLLSRNYRSTPEIVHLATEFIKRNQNRIENELYTINPKIEGNDTKIYYFNSSIQEAEFVSKEILKLIDNKNINPDDIAIIYRNNSISRDFESSLISHNIHYKVIGGFKFYDRKEIKEAIALLGFLILNEDFYFEQISQVPPKGIGPKTLEQIQNNAIDKNLNLYDSLKNLVDEKKISKPQVINFIEVIEKYRALLKSSEINNLKDFVNGFFEDTNFIEYYSEEEGRLENIHELIIDISIQIKLNDILGSFIDFSQRTTLSSSSDEKAAKDYVTLITSHSAKGTEFKVVFIVGMAEGVFPSIISINSGPKQLEEERRSFYVALTRAKEKLYLTYSGGKTFSGTFKRPSSFLNNLNLEVIEQRNNFYSGNKFTTKTYDLEDKTEDYFQDNKEITTGSNIEHNDYGIGVVIEDLDKYIKVAFDRNIGIKILIKNNKAIKYIG